MLIRPSGGPFALGPTTHKGPTAWLHDQAPGRGRERERERLIAMASNLEAMASNLIYTVYIYIQIEREREMCVCVCVPGTMIEKWICQVNKRGGQQSLLT